MHNIEKSAFRKGEYVGYGGGHVWHIKRVKTAHGDWRGRRQDNRGEWIYGKKLADISAKLAALDTPTHFKGYQLPNPFQTL